jgi:adenine deaminase
MVKMGLPSLRAIQAETVNAADLIGWSDRVGTLEPGKLADIVTVEGDPVADVSVLENMRFVMKGGQEEQMTSKISRSQSVVTTIQVSGTLYPHSALKLSNQLNGDMEGRDCRWTIAVEFLARPNKPWNDASLKLSVVLGV